MGLPQNASKAVAARLRARLKSEVLISAVIASVAMATKSRRAATDNGVEDLDLWPGQGLPVPLSEVAACRANDVGHLEGWPRHDAGSSVAGVGV